MTVGERIRALRERLEISQVDFATMVNVSKQTLYKYENGIVTNIPSDKIEAIAKIGHVSPAYLMGWEENNSSFDYLLEMQLELLGYSILYDSEGNVTLFHNTDAYEITDADVKTLRNSVLSYIKFRLHEITEHSRKYPISQTSITEFPKPHSSELKAAHERTDIETDEELKQQDYDIMNDPDF